MSYSINGTTNVPNEHVLTGLTTNASTVLGTNLRGGKWVWSAEGTFGGATIILERKAKSGSSYVPITTASLTAAGSWAIDLAGGDSVQVTISGASGTTLDTTIGFSG